MLYLCQSDFMWSRCSSGERKATEHERQVKSWSASAALGADVLCGGGTVAVEGGPFMWIADMSQRG